MKRLIDLYPYRLTDHGPEFLLLRRAKGKIYHGQWRMVGGKVKSGETSWQAALRELMEETGLAPKRFWTIPSVNTFYEYKTDTVHHIPAFAAELLHSSEPVLDDEHTACSWFDSAKAVENLHWPEQKRLVELTESILMHDQILEEWLVPLR
ncbi:NUDIX domain-containing protein [Rhodohalobacter mucosus]|uniref:NUDIX domain-containing protein n=2 Tax=Rhodohalobacter mucosus TaxID=2079485 RepID=A0A316U242_9BACT|nr:NUDIX domain-containing protein [Rhodohalobacter mucosus]